MRSVTDRRCSASSCLSANSFVMYLAGFLRSHSRFNNREYCASAPAHAHHGVAPSMQPTRVPAAANGAGHRAASRRGDPCHHRQSASIPDQQAAVGLRRPWSDHRSSGEWAADSRTGRIRRSSRPPLTRGLNPEGVWEGSDRPSAA